MAASEVLLVTHQEVLPGPPSLASDGGPSESLTHAGAKAEAAALFAMMRRTNESIDSVRELISIDPDQLDALMQFNMAKPNEAYWVLAAVRYRELVLQEFDRLGGALDSTNLPDRPRNSDSATV